MADLCMSNIADCGIGGFWDFIQFKSKNNLKHPVLQIRDFHMPG